MKGIKQSRFLSIFASSNILFLFERIITSIFVFLYLCFFRYKPSFLLKILKPSKYKWANDHLGITIDLVCTSAVYYVDEILTYELRKA